MQSQVFCKEARHDAEKNAKIAWVSKQVEYKFYAPATKPLCLQHMLRGYANEATIINTVPE